MSKKLVICAHGIGDHKADFYKAWEDILKTNHDPNLFDVAGLHWDDLQDQLWDKFFDMDEEVQKLVEKTFFGKILGYLNDPKDKETRQFLKENVFDAATYLLLSEFRKIVWNQCGIRLNELIAEHKDKSIILIGHSLGSVMLTHVTWYIRCVTGYLGYHDFFLVGSPIGMRSPVGPIPDFLELLRQIGSHANRLEALSIWAAEWWSPYDRLHIIANESDPVASDVKADVGGGILADVFPVQQGLGSKEIKRIEDVNQGTVQKFTQGSNKLSDLFANHDVSVYLNSVPFKQAFDKSLKS